AAGVQDARRPLICVTMAWRRVHFAGATPSGGSYLTTNRRPTSPAMGSFFLYTRLLLADITFVSKAIRTTVLANALDMNVSTVGSLLLKLSHQMNGLSTHPPSKLGTLPSKLPRKPPNRSTSRWSLQQSCPVSSPLAGIPTS